MNTASLLPHSAQTAPHTQLLKQLERHQHTPFQKPYTDYNQRAFHESITPYLRATSRPPLILDSGCGVGDSSYWLARQFPNHYVIGVDQSLNRLSRNTDNRQGAHPENLVFARADLIDYWRLMHEAGLSLDRHYLLYPNPWPKIGHLSRRWHGHPIFSTLIALGGVLECRSNWEIYMQELSIAIHYMCALEAPYRRFTPITPITPFEQKYLKSSHPLYQLIIDLRQKA